MKMIFTWPRAVLGLLILLAATPVSAENLLKNPDFSDVIEGLPAEWKPYENKQQLAVDAQETTGDSKQSLRVDITTDAGKAIGQIVQKVRVTPGTKYVFKIDMKSTAAGVGFGQIKLLVGSSEIERLASAKSGTEWAPVELAFDSGEANQVWVVLRYNQRQRDVGQKLWFANASLVQGD